MILGGIRPELLTDEPVYYVQPNGERIGGIVATHRIRNLDFEPTYQVLLEDGTGIWAKAKAWHSHVVFEPGYIYYNPKWHTIGGRNTVPLPPQDASAIRYLKSVAHAIKDEAAEEFPGKRVQFTLTIGSSTVTVVGDQVQVQA